MSVTTVTVFLNVRVQPCAERLAQEARGLFGWHDSPGCALCIKTSTDSQAHAGSNILAPLLAYGGVDLKGLAARMRLRYPQATVRISEHPVYYQS